MIEDITNMFGGGEPPKDGSDLFQSTEKTEELLRGTFNDLMINILFKQYCESTDNPKLMASEVLEMWEKRVDDRTQKELETIKKVLPEGFEDLFSILGINLEEINLGLSLAKGKVREEIEALITVPNDTTEDE